VHDPLELFVLILLVLVLIIDWIVVAVGLARRTGGLATTTAAGIVCSRLVRYSLGQVYHGQFLGVLARQLKLFLVELAYLDLAGVQLLFLKRKIHLF